MLNTGLLSTRNSEQGRWHVGTLARGHTTHHGRQYVVDFPAHRGPVQQPGRVDHAFGRLFFPLQQGRGVPQGFHNPGQIWTTTRYDRVSNVRPPYNINTKKRKLARINRTPKVIRACLCTMWSILHVVPRARTRASARTTYQIPKTPGRPCPSRRWPRRWRASRRCGGPVVHCSSMSDM